MLTDLRRVSQKLRWAGLALVALAILFVPAPQVSAHPAERYFRIEASSFAFDPGVISVQSGDRVTIDLVATDYVHGLKIDGYGLEMTADPGQTSRMTFIADRPGSFHLRCSVPCGQAHPFMIGKLNVGPNWTFYRLAGLAVLAAAAAVWILLP